MQEGSRESLEKNSDRETISGRQHVEEVAEGSGCSADRDVFDHVLEDDIGVYIESSRGLYFG